MSILLQVDSPAVEAICAPAPVNSKPLMVTLLAAIVNAPIILDSDVLVPLHGETPAFAPNKVSDLLSVTDSL